MVEDLLMQVGVYWQSLMKYLLSEWRHMTPMKYGTMLIGIGVFGWLLMKHGPRKV